MKLFKQCLAALIILLPLQVMAEVVVVVGKDSPISSLSESQLRQLYLEGSGRIGGTSVKALDLPEDNRARKEFYQEAVGKTPAQMKSYWARMIFTGRGAPPRMVSGNRAMQVMLENNPELIGYLPGDQVSSGLKVLYRLP
ncbi:hypothetical protein MWU49_15665 [Alcanivorax sp. S6407]|uniref:hypothetical protein n=1 Tax=Alcanivorax sp. S6407 TaxID=2926424 RepID=UPI001FF2642B|nr:hypothetical protein [Alcanivorax sp. S6407]MCK0155152.1 hypothetical protein [Alcanivorax sp. S6407]